VKPEEVRLELEEESKSEPANQEAETPLTARKVDEAKDEETEQSLSKIEPPHFQSPPSYLFSSSEKVSPFTGEQSKEVNISYPFPLELEA